MKFNLLFLFLRSNKPKVFIINNDKPTCKNCIYFKEHPDPYNKYNLGTCTLFGLKDNISGNIIYDYASTCRVSHTLCGKSGEYYIEKIDPIII